MAATILLALATAIFVLEPSLALLACAASLAEAPRLPADTRVSVTRLA